MKILASCATACALLAAATAVAVQKDARVTQVVHEVKLLPGKAAPRAAALNDTVRDGTSVRTGDSSRSELTFQDLTITRLGANSIFSFNKAGRDVELQNGSVLLRVPKDSGGATIITSAVTAGITGTTVIVETRRAGRNRLLVLEGTARLALNQHRDQVKTVRAGQMLDVPRGATTLPDPVDIDLNNTLKTHPLLADFPPLPSQPLIVAAADAQRHGEPVYHGQPVGGAPIAGGGGGGFPFPPRFPNPNPPSRGNPGGAPSGGSGANGGQPGGKPSGGQPGGRPPGGRPGGSGATNATGSRGGTSTPPKRMPPKPTPPPDQPIR